MKYPTRLLAGFSVIVLIFGSTENKSRGTEQDTDPFVLEDVVDAWRNRTEKAQVIEFRWLSKCFSRVAREGGGKNMPKTYTYERTTRLLLDRSNRVYVDTNRARWSEDEQKLVPEWATHVFDGNVTTILFPDSAAGFPNAHTGHGKAEDIVRNQRMIPMRLVFRPLDDALGIFDAGNLVLTDEQAVIDGQNMLVIRQTGNREKVVWVDPKRNYVPTRYLEILHGVVMWQCDLTYREDSTVSWVPSHWNLVRLGSGGIVVESDTCEVEQYSINRPVENADFEIELPNGTFVQDGRTKSQYILREKSEKRIVLEEEDIVGNYKEIFQSETPLQNVSWNRTLLITANAVIVTLLVFLVIWRNRDRIMSAITSKPKDI